MTRRWWGMVIVLGTLVPPAAAAQVRQVTGTVTNSQTGQGVAEATIAVQGTRIVAQAGPDGRYTLNAPDGPLALVTRAIGFRSHTDTIPPGDPAKRFKADLRGYQVGPVERVGDDPSAYWALAAERVGLTTDD